MTTLYSLYRSDRCLAHIIAFWTLLRTVDNSLQFSTQQVYSDPCVSYADNRLYVNGFWAEDCTFMATVGSPGGTILSPSNTYIGRLDKDTNELVFGYSNYEGVNNKFLLFFEDVEGTMDARLTYFGNVEDNFCPDN